MRLGKNTINVLKNFASINPSIYLRKGSLVTTKSLNNVIYAEANLTDVIDADIALYDVAGFLNVLTLFGEDAEITVGEGDSFATISGKRSSVKYSVVDPSVIIFPKNPVKFPESNLEFKLRCEDFTQVIKASATLGLPELCITRKDDKIVIEALDRKNPSANSFTVEAAEYTGEEDFRYYVSVSNLKMEKADYVVRIASPVAIQFEGAVSTHIVALEKVDQA